MTDIGTIAQAHLNTHHAVQRLTYVLEGQGVITETELAHIWGETPAAVAVASAASQSERAAEKGDCAHGVITEAESRVIPRELSGASDCESGSEGCAR